LLYSVFPLVGGVVAVLFVWLLGLRRFTVSGLVFGALVILFSVMVQNPIQNLPVLIALRSELVGVTRVEEVQRVVREFIESIGLAGVIGLCLWIGFVAGVVQTGFKYLFISIVLRKSYRGALSLGLSFGFTEAVIVTALALLLAFTVTPGTPTLWMAALSGVAAAFERFSATLFHVGTSLYIAHTANQGAALRGVLTVTAIHGSIDTAAAIYQVGQAYQVVNTTVALAAAGIAMVATLLIGLYLTLKHRGKILEET